MEDNQTPPVPQEPQAPMEPTPVDAPKEVKPELTKSEKRRLMLKRLKWVGGITYGVLLVVIIAWALIFGTKDVSSFDYLPISQAGFNRFMWLSFNWLMGLGVVALFLGGMIALGRSIFAKKDQVDLKKRFSKRAMWMWVGFAGYAILWLVLMLALVGPRLVVEERYTSPIITEPKTTIGLTAPMDIVFDARSVPIDTGSYDILSYSWNFGDGDTANGSVVSHRYTKKADGDGIYTVRLTVTYMDLKSGNQFTSEFQKDVSFSNELVAAAFIANPDSGEIPLKVTFDASLSYDPDGEIIAWEWDLDGDGQFDDAEGEIVEHTFTQEGEFEVSLRVTDNNGEYNVTSQIIESGSVGGLRAVITSDVLPGDPYYLGENYAFDGTLSQIRDGSITKFSWDFGDGDTSSSRTTQHTYEETGTYTIVLIVTDAAGNQDRDELEIQVVEEGEAPDAKIVTDPAPDKKGIISGPVPLSVRFDGSTSTDSDDDIVEYSWDFDSDGNIDEVGDTVNYTYTETGTYDARLIVEDAAGLKNETTVEIQVTAQGVIAILDITPSNGEVPLTVEFDASRSTYKEGEIVSYEYDFGDGSDTYIGGSEVTYRYDKVGTYSVSVTALGDDGESATDTAQVVVRPVALTACFEVNTDSGSAPLFVSVDPSCAQGTIRTYEWDFGDGEISFDRKPETHIYTKSGSYTIELEVTSDKGIVDTFIKEITVK